jgi:TIR domain
MGHVFMSYAHADIGVVDRLADALKQPDLAVWLDRDEISGGAAWRAYIVQAIKTAEVFLIALSPDSVKSRNVCKELAVAENANVPILPLVLRQATVPDDMEYTLAELQRVDLSDDFVAGLGRLRRAVSKLRKVRPTSLRSAEELEWMCDDVQESVDNTRQNATPADPAFPPSMQKFIEEFEKLEDTQARKAQVERLHREIQTLDRKREAMLATAQETMAHADNGPPRETCRRDAEYSR